MDDLIPARNGTRPLFDARDREKSGRLMSVLDAINEKFGHGALMPAATGIKKREWRQNSTGAPAIYDSAR